jgi:hypothetical protein
VNRHLKTPTITFKIIGRGGGGGGSTIVEIIDFCGIRPKTFETDCLSRKWNDIIVYIKSTDNNINDLNSLLVVNSLARTTLYVLHCNLISTVFAATLTKMIRVISLTIKQNVKNSFLSTANSKVYNYYTGLQLIY